MIGRAQRLHSHYVGESLLSIPSGVLAIWIFLWLLSVLALAGAAGLFLLVSGSMSLSRNSGKPSETNVTVSPGRPAVTHDPYLLIPVEPQ